MSGRVFVLVVSILPLSTILIFKFGFVPSVLFSFYYVEISSSLGDFTGQGEVTLGEIIVIVILVYVLFCKIYHNMRD